VTALRLRPQDCPRYRLREVGPPYLSTPEILAVLLTGLRAGEALDLGRALLARFGSLDQLAQANLTELCQVPGVGQARAAQIQAAFELSRRRATDGQAESPHITSPASAAQVLREHADRANARRQEEFYVLLLDTRNRLLGVEMVYRGTLNSAPFRAADLLREPVRQGAASVVLAHNHPSLNPEPSPEDIAVTRDFQRACALMGIELLDHVILGQGYVSLKEKGFLCG